MEKTRNFLSEYTIKIISKMIYLIVSIVLIGIYFFDPHLSISLTILLIIFIVAYQITFPKFPMLSSKVLIHVLSIIFLIFALLISKIDIQIHTIYFDYPNNKLTINIVLN